MISAGDSILLGLSGGKDSLLLLLALRELQQRSPVNFNLVACTVDPLEKQWDSSELKNLCGLLEVPWHHEKHDIFGIMKIREERSPCSFCANMRRGILNSIAQKKGCNLLALGHHQDDAIETVFLNLFSGGRFRCFSPKMYQSNTKITVIRPLIYLKEERIAREIERLSLLPATFECPYEKKSHRGKTKALVKNFETKIPSLRSNILHALKYGEPEDTWATFFAEKKEEPFPETNEEGQKR
ncbi:MAG TPA: ATP-binding protein [Synergistaceae bacterium]|nr:ATP-binding protein [Synergistaceae bacterium]HPJ25692.1 ATP-binding protein [Synergistaceae bacterium]HPQ37637.1 ATP-binding protein [Synergistaceae bacterium]